MRVCVCRLDRCIAAHKRPTEQNLFGIIQGGLDPELRRVCLREMIARDLPGYAIGGLSGGEAKVPSQASNPPCHPSIAPRHSRIGAGELLEDGRH